MSATKANKTPKTTSSSTSPPPANQTTSVSPKPLPKPAAKTLFNYFTKLSKDKTENDLNESNRKRKLSSENNQQPPVKILKSSDEVLTIDDNSELSITESTEIDNTSSENIISKPVEEKKPLIIKLTPANKKKKETKNKNTKRKGKDEKSELALVEAMEVEDVVVNDDPANEKEGNVKVQNDKNIIDQEQHEKEKSKSAAKSIDIPKVEIIKDNSTVGKDKNIEKEKDKFIVDQKNDIKEKNSEGVLTAAETQKDKVVEEKPKSAQTQRRKSTRIENSQEKAAEESRNAEVLLEKTETKRKIDTSKHSASDSKAKIFSKGEKEDISEPVNVNLDDNEEIVGNSSENGINDISIISENMSDGGLSGCISPEINRNTPLQKLNVSSEKKPTPKQLKYQEKRRKAREEREKKIQEEREKRQKEKEEMRRKEREEKELKLKKEREEKEEQRKKEKAEKNEEKRKREELKEEEKRKKEEERKKKDAEKEEEKREKEQERLKKEQEKLEEEQKKKREADKFKRFFRNSVEQTNPTTSGAGGSISISSSQGNDTSNPATEALSNFMPFCVKGNMKLAPCTRKILTDDQKIELENIFEGENLVYQNSYLKQLKSQKYVIGKSEKTIPNFEDDDVMIVGDEMDTIGDEVVELKPKRQKYRAKFLLFNGNRRPPYYGTWRKKSAVVKPCKPFEMDTKYFNYEVDSDDEWEEDEPGESLKGSDDDYESNDDYEVDNEFFVPHGYLSDEENNGEEADIEENDNHPNTQKAKLKILQQEFFAEHNKKTEKIKPKLIGCIWQNLNEDGADDKYPAIIHKLLENHGMIMNAPIILKPEISPAEDNQTENTTNIEFTTEEIQELTKLIHGNVHKRQFLVEEYLASRAEKLEIGKKQKLTKVKINNKIRQIAEWKRCVTDNSVMKNRYCWVVGAKHLDEFNLSDLGVFNTWKYTLKPLRTIPTASIAKEDSNDVATSIVTPSTAISAVTTVANSITKYTTQISKIPSKSVSSTKPIATSSRTSNVTKKSPTQTKPDIATSSNRIEPTKKRVNLLMSVPRGQTFPQNQKNTLISEFLNNGKLNNNSSNNNNVSTDDIISKSKITVKTSNPKAADETLSMDCDVIQLD